MLHFDSDYMRGACPEIMRRLVETNLEQTIGYGLDDYCLRAKQLIKEACGLDKGDVYFLVGGTQTNATVIDGLLARHEGVVAVETGHINVHESGAIEASGHKVITLKAHDGKMSAQELDEYVTKFYMDETYEHCVAPGLVYLTQATECGTIYSKAELGEIAAVCRKHSIPVYLDGARLGYGLMAQGSDLTLKDIAALCDVFSIGGTKQGALFGEAVVCTRDDLLKHFFPLIKQHGALLAKGRLLGIQFETLFTDGLYFRLAANAIDKALKLKELFLKKGYKLYSNSPSNQQFFILPNEVIDRIIPKVSFELWGPRGEKETVVRFVTDWATSDEEIEQLANINFGGFGKN